MAYKIGGGGSLMPVPFTKVFAAWVFQAHFKFEVKGMEETR
mgnify:FL=1